MISQKKFQTVLEEKDEPLEPVDNHESKFRLHEGLFEEKLDNSLQNVNSQSYISQTHATSTMKPASKWLKNEKKKIDKDNFRLMLKILNIQSSEDVCPQSVKEFQDRVDHHKNILKQKKGIDPIDKANMRMMKNMIDQ